MAAARAAGKKQGVMAPTTDRDRRSATSPSPPPGQPRVGPVLLEGWLTKQGRIVKSWRRRYFRLVGGHVDYYVDNSLAERRGTFDLSKAFGVVLGPECDVTWDPSALKVEERGFAVVCFHRTYFIYADSQQARDKWYEVLLGELARLGSSKQIQAKSKAVLNEIEAVRQKEKKIARQRQADAVARSMRMPSYDGPKEFTWSAPPQSGADTDRVDDDDDIVDGYGGGGDVLYAEPSDETPTSGSDGTALYAEPTDDTDSESLAGDSGLYAEPADDDDDYDDDTGDHDDAAAGGACDGVASADELYAEPAADIIPAGKANPTLEQGSGQKHPEAPAVHASGDDTSLTGHSS